MHAVDVDAGGEDVGVAAECERGEVDAVTAAKDARLHEGAEVDVTIREGQLVIAPVLSLAGLVAGIIATNLPAIDDDDALRGGEQW